MLFFLLILQVLQPYSHAFLPTTQYSMLARKSKDNIINFDYYLQFNSISKDLNCRSRRQNSLFRMVVEGDDDEISNSRSSRTIDLNERSTVSINEQSTVGLKSRQNERKKKTNFLEGRWELMHGNYILRPPINSSYSVDSYDATTPKALIHFLGGALIGASPHNAYRYILEKLSERGYIIVATPYQLTFDHLKTCDEIISKFERCAPSLARQYGAIPVVGVGHSCGALLQVLITSLFPDTPRAANILMSYNNKSVRDAVPAFDEIVSPLSMSLANPPLNSTSFAEGGESWSPPSILDALSLGLQLMKSSTEGDNLPSDELISEVTTKMFPPGTPFSKMTLPQNARDSIQPLITPTASTLSDSGILPIVNQLIEVTEQVPSLLQEVADGVEDFIPSPDAVGAVAKKAYRARTTLLLKFDNDSLDETEDLATILAEAERIMRMKRPMVSMGIKTVTLSGNHATPIIAPPLAIASKAEDILGSEAKDKLLYKQADDVVESISSWLEGIVE